MEFRATSLRITARRSRRAIDRLMRKASYQGLFLQVAERMKKKIWPQANEYTYVQFNLSHWASLGQT